LDQAAGLRESAYVIDLAWMRTIPWRERLASSFDLPARRGALRGLTEVCVRHHPGSLASAALVVGWLASRLGWESEPLQALGGEGWFGKASDGGPEHEIKVSLVPSEQDVPGLAGVTVGWDGCAFSLDRAPGGLRAVARESSGEEQCWQVLGASRGEGGILGEGVRQALLRDTTYGPALDEALVLRCRARS
jgi:hypothetical protein